MTTTTEAVFGVRVMNDDGTGLPGGAAIIHFTAKTLRGSRQWRLNAQQAINSPE
jgi:gamma-glutamyltranspeptidase